MAVDHFLDRHRAGHGVALAEECRRGAQDETAGPPERPQNGRTDPPFGHDPIERRQMATLDPQHFLDDGGTCGLAKNGELAPVDLHRAEFAGLIDPDHPFDLGPPGRIARQRRTGFRRSPHLAAPRGLARPAMARLKSPSPKQAARL